MTFLINYGNDFAIQIHMLKGSISKGCCKFPLFGKVTDVSKVIFFSLGFVEVVSNNNNNDEYLT